MEIKRVEIQDTEGNIYYPQTDAKSVTIDNKTLDFFLNNLQEQNKSILSKIHPGDNIIITLNDDKTITISTAKKDYLDTETYKGESFNSVKLADKAKNIISEETAVNNSFYVKDETGKMTWRELSTLEYNPSNNIIDQTPIIAKNIKSGKGSVTTNMGTNAQYMFSEANKFSTSLYTSNKTLIITIDFGQILKFNSIGILSDYGCINNFKIYISNDNNSYTLADSYVYSSNDKEWIAKEEFRILLNKVIEAKYIKIESTGVFENLNRYEISKLSFYYDKNFDDNLFTKYNNSSSPYYFKKETYNKTEIDKKTSDKAVYVTKQFTPTVYDKGVYHYSSSSEDYSSGLYTDTTEPIIDFKFSDTKAFNIISLTGTGYGGVNDLEVYESNDGVIYKLIQSIQNANIYTKDQYKYIALRKPITSNYFRLKLKKNVGGNRYEFCKIRFIYDKKIDITPSLTCVNSTSLFT